MEDIYDKRIVQFKNLTGRVFLTATASHYLEDFSGKTTSKESANGGSSSWFSGSSSNTSKKESARNVMKGVYHSSITGNAFKFANDQPVRN